MAHFLASHAWDLGFHAILRVFSAAANAKYQSEIIRSETYTTWLRGKS